CRACMSSLVTEGRQEQLRRGVDDVGLLREVVVRVHVAGEPHEALYARQLTKMRLEPRQRVHGRDARSLPGGLEVDVGVAVGVAVRVAVGVAVGAGLGAVFGAVLGTVPSATVGPAPIPDPTGEDDAGM